MTLADGILARARFYATAMAEHIKAGAHQLGACGLCGLPWRTHMRWMAADVPEDTDVAYYQSQVLAALEQQRQQSLKNGAAVVKGAASAKANAAYNVWKHSHEERFRRFATFDEAPNKVELTGADGGPLTSTQLPATRDQAFQALQMAAQNDADLAERLKKLGGGE